MAVLDSVLKAYQSPTRMVHAIGALSALGDEATTLNVKRPLVVTDPFMVSSGLVRSCLDPLASHSVAIGFGWAGGTRLKCPGTAPTTRSTSA